LLKKRGVGRGVEPKLSAARRALAAAPSAVVEDGVDVVVECGFK